MKINILKSEIKILVEINILNLRIYPEVGHPCSKEEEILELPSPNSRIFLELRLLLLQVALDLVPPPHLLSLPLPSCPSPSPLVPPLLQQPHKVLLPVSLGSDEVHINQSQLQVFGLSRTEYI